MARSPWAPGAPALAAAARAVDAVATRGQAADAALAPFAQRDDRPAVRAIALGTIRWYLRLAPAVETLLNRPSAVSGPMRALLVVAAHQVEYSRNAPEMSVHAAVDAARLLGEERAAGLANAVLRRFVAERATVLASVDADVAARTAHPPWLIGRLSTDWPEQCPSILAANNAHPPMTLRVDTSRVERSTYLEQLREAGIDSQAVQWIDSAVVLNRPMTVSKLPGFSEGAVSVQDAGAQLAGPLLGMAPGMRVLDACAAPGGKTAHILELTAGAVDLTAVDIDPERARLIEGNLARLHRTARVVVADAREAGRFWDGLPYDRILVDAPCSSTGVIRRHPDIKLLRRPQDIPALATGQVEILRAAVRMLAPGGRLLYSTCSVLKEENDQVVAGLLAAEPEMRVRSLPPARELAPGAIDCTAGVQLLPGAEAGTDGFYYACLEKTTTGA